MSAVYLPGSVGVLVRRLANVVASLGISNQYLLARKADLEASSPTASPSRGDEWLISEEEGDRRRRISRMPSDVAEPPSVLKTESLESSRSSSVQGHVDIGFPPQMRNSRSIERPPLPPEPEPERSPPDSPTDTIHQLLTNPALYNPIRKPRYPIVLCHGLYGFDVRGPASIPSLQMHYWSSVLSVLRNIVGAEVIVAGVPPTGSIISRSERLHDFLRQRATGRAINFIGHSMGGLDCRYLITHVQPTEFTPVSLTTISTPHRGSPFMDWCRQYIGIGKPRLEHGHLKPVSTFTPYFDPSDPEHFEASPSLLKNTPSRADSQNAPSTPAQSQTATPFSLSTLPSSFTTLLLSLIDSPAYSNLTTAYLRDTFNPSTPDDPRVKYFSVAARTASMSVWHPLWLPKMVLDNEEEKEKAAFAVMNDSPSSSSSSSFDGLDDRIWGNDGLVSVESAKWGEFLGTLEGVDHWEIRGARGIGLEFGSSFGKSEMSPNSMGESWNWRDWGRFVGAWNREEKRREAVQKASATSSAVTSSPNVEALAKEEEEKARLDGILRSSTEKLSTVVDWITEQTPSIPSSMKNINININALNALGRVVGASASKEAEAKAKTATSEGKKAPPQKKSDLATKMDLERFYVALSRKLYDEGL